MTGIQQRAAERTLMPTASRSDRERALASPRDIYGVSLRGVWDYLV